jgi:tetrahydromethanopterin S-methyltransferase subunit B
MVWADGRLSEYGGTNQKVAFARKRQMPNPEIFMSPNAGPGGETVTVQGHGFQPDLDYYLLVGGEPVASGRTSSDGRMTASVFIPISGEGPHPVTLVDGSGNLASTSFYMEFGFDNIQAQLEELNTQVDELSNGASSQRSPVASQPASYDPRIEQLTAQVSELKTLVQQQAQPMAAAPAAETTVAAAGFLGSNPTMKFGLVGLVGLLLGIVLTQLRLFNRR